MCLSDNLRRVWIYLEYLLIGNIAFWLQIMNEIIISISTEHRNMPFEDAIVMIAQSFTEWKRSLCDDTGPPMPNTPPVSMRPEFIPPDKHLIYLLSLAADCRHLNIEDLDDIIAYMTDRRRRLAADLGLKKVVAPQEPEPGILVLHYCIIAVKNYLDVFEAATHLISKFLQNPEHTAVSSYFFAAIIDKATSTSERQHKELQAKILNLLQGEPIGVNPNSSFAPLDRPRFNIDSSAGTVQARLESSRQYEERAGLSTAINFDSPQVQRALDNLIASPTLLQELANAQQLSSFTGNGMRSGAAQHGGGDQQAWRNNGQQQPPDAASWWGYE